MKVFYYVLILYLQEMSTCRRKILYPLQFGQGNKFGLKKFAQVLSGCMQLCFPCFNFQPVKNSTLHLSFESFTLFEEHTLIITVQDFHTYANKTSVNVTSVVVANVTGEDIPSDFMFNMDDANVMSRQVMVNFSSKYQRQSRSAEVGAGFQMKYEYLNSSKYKGKVLSVLQDVCFFHSKVTSKNLKDLNMKF